jgi:hypothetical protein
MFWAMSCDITLMSLSYVWNCDPGTHMRCIQFSTENRVWHPRNVEVYEIREMSFQEHRTCDDLESRTCEAPKPRTCEGLESWTCEAPKSQTCEGLESWTCEATQSQTCEGLESRTCEASESRTCKDPKSWTCETTKIGSLRNSGICWRTSSEVMAHEDFLNDRIHEQVRSKVKYVVSKSPGFACELVADL